MVGKISPSVIKSKQSPIQIRDFSKQARFWKAVSLTLLFAVLLSVLLPGSKRPANEQIFTLKSSPEDVQKQKTTESFFYFSSQNLEQPLSQYDCALLASPKVLSEQKSKTWEPLECLYSNKEKNYYSFSEINQAVDEEVLISGLQTIENYKYKIVLKDEEENILSDDRRLQEIGYTQICKDKQNYYALFLTMADKEDKSEALMRPVWAAGGWLGRSNLAIIPFSGEVRIYEDIDSISQKIAVDDLLKAGSSSPTSRSFAYYNCHSFKGKLGEDLYAFCGGEGGSSLYRISLEPVSFEEVSFCRWDLSEGLRICYDLQGKIYYKFTNKSLED